jgi:hypothetical protein
LKRLGAPPWRLISGGTPRAFGPNTAAPMVEWIRGHQLAGRSVFAMLPAIAEGGHSWIAGRVPLQGSPAALDPPPQLMLCADDYTCIWKLAAPIQEAQARRLVTRLVKAQKGKDAVGEPVPLPGTIMFRQTGIRLAGRFPVTWLPPIKTPAYHLVGDRLRASGQDAPVDDAFKRGDQMDAAPLPWLWPGILPAGQFTAIMGAPKAGKSTVALDIVARVTRGAAWPCGAPGEAPGSALVIEAEDPEPVTRGRLIAAGADMRRVLAASVPMDLSSADGMRELQRQVAKLDTVRLIVLSPFREMFGAEAARQVEARAKLRPLLDYCQANGIALLGIMHKEAGKRGDSAEHLGGPKVYAQRARMILNAGVDPDHPLAKQRPAEASRLLSIAGGNLGSDKTRLRYDLEGVRLENGAEVSRVRWLK